MKKHIITIILLIFTISIFAQNPKISFIYDTYDYGTIREEDGKQKCTFYFINTGDAPLKITTVRPMCGCTTSDYTKTEVNPQDTGFINAVYDAHRRPGPFHKAISVHCNDPENGSLSLAIKGTVTPRQKTEADNYPTIKGNLRFKENYLKLDIVTNKQIRVDTVVCYNNWTKPMTIEIENKEPFITTQLSTNTISPKSSAYIIVTYNGIIRGEWGYIFDSFIIKTNDVIEPEKEYYISANLLEDFSTLSEKDLQKAPKIEFDTINYNFGTVQQGLDITYNFKFKNTGKKDLEIRSVKSSGKYLTAISTLTTIKKRQVASIDINFDTRTRSGKQHKTVTVITNDPNRPTVILHIQGIVKK